MALRFDRVSYARLRELIDALNTLPSAPPAPLIETASPRARCPAPVLTDPIAIGGRLAPSRVVFGPHATNLGRGRAIGARHVAYYARRAGGGAGVIITETASVTADDWPYERAPLAADCGPAGGAIADACRPHGTVVLAGLGHAGGQGSSAYSQSVLWAPSRVADVVSREPPAELDQAGIDGIVAAFAAAARLAVSRGPGRRRGRRRRLVAAAPVPVRSHQPARRRIRRGPPALHPGGAGRGARRHRARTGSWPCASPATSWPPGPGSPPTRPPRPWPPWPRSLDLLTVIRAGPYSTTRLPARRPHRRRPPISSCAGPCGAAAGGQVPVVLQGSVADPDAAEAALADGYADLVEMTRAQIADARLVALVRAGHPERARPCLLCNQTCQVRDNRNPLVTCVGDPRSGHETTDPDPDAGPTAGRRTGRRPAARRC